MSHTPKPSSYRGQLYRSRLEARWAIYFDWHPLVTRWEYEPRKFTLDKQGWDYTPDFQIQYRSRFIYIEVKPCTVTPEYYWVLQEYVRAHSLELWLCEGNFYQGNPTIRSLLDDKSLADLVDFKLLPYDTSSHIRCEIHRFDLDVIDPVPPHRRQPESW